MIKREEMFKKAFEQKRMTLARKRAEYDIKYTALASVEPRLKQLEREIAAAGAEVAITALSGDGASLNALKERISELSAEREAIAAKMELGGIEYECPLCRDTGYVEGKICDCIRETVKALTVKALSSELSIEDCSFDNFDLSFYPDCCEGGANPHAKMQQILDFCRSYTLKFNPKVSESVIFMGDTGVGKTHLSFSIVTELLNKGFEVVYGSAYNLFSKIETEHYQEHTNECYDAAIGCDLLVIDDLGSEFTTPYYQSTFFNIINTRMLAKKPTLINTNLTPKEIEGRYTPRVSSRIFGNYSAHKFSGSDVRVAKKIKEHNEAAKNA